MTRIIAHLDMDAFFASVEERDHPRLKGLPIAVGSDPMEGSGRGVVSTANYKAREYGIRSALPISKAWQYSEKAKREGQPEVVFLPVDMRRYAEVSDNIMKIIRRYSETIEESSIDEAYFDLSYVFDLVPKAELSDFLKLGFGKSEEVAQALKNEIWKKEKLTASIGIGPNKLIAKIASDMQKPDGLTVITSEDAEKFLEPLTIRKIPGIGPKTEKYFHGLGIYKIKDLKKFPQNELEKILGKWGSEIYRKARGIDDSPLVEEYEIKSVGEQETFSRDTLDFRFVLDRLDFLARNVIRRFRRNGFDRYRTVTVTVRFSDFETKTRSHTRENPASDLKTLKAEAIRLIMPFFDGRENPKRKLIRLIGVRIEKLENSQNQS